MPSWPTSRHKKSNWQRFTVLHITQALTSVPATVITNLFDFVNELFVKKPAQFDEFVRFPADVIKQNDEDDEGIEVLLLLLHML